MLRSMLKSKIQGAVVTATDLYYEGSITLDEDLLRRADILPGEEVHVLSISTGARFVTYTIPAPKGSGTVLLNGPAARLGEVGDHLIILAYGFAEDDEAGSVEPRIVKLGENNRPDED